MIWRTGIGMEHARARREPSSEATAHVIYEIVLRPEERMVTTCACGGGRMRAREARSSSAPLLQNRRCPGGSSNRAKALERSMIRGKNYNNTPSKHISPPHHHGVGAHDVDDVDDARRSGYSVRMMRWTPLSVSTTPLTSPTLSANAAFENAGCIFSNVNRPRSPPLR